MQANMYLLKVTYCIGNKRDNSDAKSIKLRITDGLRDVDLKILIKQEINTERKITIIAKRKVSK